MYVGDSDFDISTALSLKKGREIKEKEESEGTHGGMNIKYESLEA